METLNKSMCPHFLRMQEIRNIKNRGKQKQTQEI